MDPSPLTCPPLIREGEEESLSWVVVQVVKEAKESVLQNSSLRTESLRVIEDKRRLGGVKGVSEIERADLVH